MKEFIQEMYQKKNFWGRLVAVILAVITMGFSLSWLVLVDMGTDPCTSMNLAISAKLGMSIGNWQALFNSVLFVFVIFLGRKISDLERLRICSSWAIHWIFQLALGKVRNSGVF